ncbi:hypothetical protein C1646_739642 [Rhizophagus diaphanus]|nr:hypothetical protein C1646_739642 [Rhizophagus diaphanus] [Rhizophagus sp. MUCL 43196]
MAMNNSSLKPINHLIRDGSIDWSYTKKWINHNPTDTPTSDKLRKIHAEKIKKSTFNYTTGDILRRNYPKLYPPGQILCTNCDQYEDTNAHVGLCPSHRSNILTVLNGYKQKLLNLIKEKNTSSFTFDIDHNINNSNMFKLLPDTLNQALLQQTDTSTPRDDIQIPKTQPWILLLHHLIPTELSDLFYMYFGQQKLRDHLLIQYVADFTTALKISIWSIQARNFKKWEKSLNITSKKKKQYRRHHKRPLKDSSNMTRSTTDNINLRGHYSAYYYNKSLPYFKHLITLDDSASIRWTTCNFLHSGTWESYRDTLSFNNFDYLPDFSFIRSP